MRPINRDSRARFLGYNLPLSIQQTRNVVCFDTVEWCSAPHYSFCSLLARSQLPQLISMPPRKNKAKGAPAPRAAQRRRAPSPSPSPPAHSPTASSDSLASPTGSTDDDLPAERPNVRRKINPNSLANLARGGARNRIDQPQPRPAPQLGARAADAAPTYDDNSSSEGSSREGLAGPAGSPRQMDWQEEFGGGFDGHGGDAGWPPYEYSDLSDAESAPDNIADDEELDMDAHEVVPWRIFSDLVEDSAILLRSLDNDMWVVQGWDANRKGATVSTASSALKSIRSRTNAALVCRPTITISPPETTRSAATAAFLPASTSSSSTTDLISTAMHPLPTLPIHTTTTFLKLSSSPSDCTTA